MLHIDACPECLRRAWLLAMLGPHIERTVLGHAASEACALLALTDEDLATKVAGDGAPKILTAVAEKSEADLHEELTAAACWAVCRHSDHFPPALRDIEGAPRALIGRGDRGFAQELLPSRVITVVGSRRATTYGREVARSLGAELASAGALVTSGLAFGVDACAHRGALDAGRATIAVLGCGPDIAYPAAHRALWRRITEAGAVLSELPPGAPPWRWTFKARNRIMAALAGMTVVVEAAERSGTLVTARFASEFGRQVGAVPGPITSRASVGSNALLREGAHVIRNAEDVLLALR